MTKEQDLDYPPETALEIARAEEPPPAFGGLDAMNWAVINAEECAVSGLTYEQARKFLELLEKEGISGLCIVTNRAGERLSGAPETAGQPKDTTTLPKF